MLIALLIGTLGCTRNDLRLSRLERIDDLMDADSKAAYDSLCSFSDSICKSIRVQMKYRLLKAKAQNKLYLQMPSDSIFQEVVDYYKSKGTSNEKMQSLYLLGCIYRDQYEVPMAIQCYREAVESVDTTTELCDYTTLYRVYGQMASAYEDQSLYKEAIDAYKNYSLYALRAGKIYDYIHGKELSALIYYEESDTLKSLEQTKECIKLYEKNNMLEDAAAAVQSIIFYHLTRENFDSAYHYMQKYDKNSGLFINGVTTQVGYYNYYKGVYYEGIGILDSAEHFYRELPKYGYNCECYKGLLNIYTKKQNTDSISKYVSLYEETYHDFIARNQTKAVKLASSMYDYSRLQKENLEAKYKEGRNLCIFGFTSLFLVSLLACSLIYLKYYREKKSAEMKIHQQNYISLKNKLQIAESDLGQMKSDSAFAIQSKMEEIEQLQAKIESYESAHTDKEIEVLQRMDELSERFVSFASPKPGSARPKQSDWNELVNFFRNNYVCLCVQFNTCRLSQQEEKVCMLAFSGISNGDISNLLGVSPQRVTNLKAMANEKMFGERNAKNLCANMQSVKLKNNVSIG